MDAEHRRPVGPHARATRDHQYGTTDQPGHQPADGPSMAPPTQPDEAGHISGGQHHPGNPDQTVEPPQGDQPAHIGRLRQFISQKDVPRSELMGNEPWRGLNGHRADRRQHRHHRQCGRGGAARRSLRPDEELPAVEHPHQHQQEPGQ
ncbi:Copper resistance protein D [Mycobacterium marinum MB2]|nr:Copper resistance protein D [Mycobacterium marinum MB2]